MFANWIARDKWFGFDKLDHFAWSVAFWLFLTVVVSDAWARVGWFATGAIAVEVAQLVRFRAWVRKGRPHPYPAFADGISYKDLIWDAGGAIAAALALARYAARAALITLPLLFVAGLSAQQITVAKAPEFRMAPVYFDSVAYGQEFPMYLRPRHGFFVRGPAGDEFVLLNATHYDSLVVCTPPSQRAVAIARLVIGNRDSLWWGQNFERRGQARAYMHWQQALPSGDTLRLVEAWRRHSECTDGDGALVLVVSFRRGARR